MEGEKLCEQRGWKVSTSMSVFLSIYLSIASSVYFRICVKVQGGFVLFTYITDFTYIALSMFLRIYLTIYLSILAWTRL